MNLSKTRCAERWLRRVPKMRLLMRISLLVTTTLCLHLGVLAFSQNISVSVEKAPLRNVLDQIEKASSYRFLYNDNPVFENKSVSIHVENAPLNKVMRHILRGTDISYKVSNNNLVVLTAYPRRPVDRQVEIANNDVEVTGLVTDGAGNPFAGVSVSVKNSQKGTIGTTTDINGRYVLVVPENATLVFSMVGYAEQEITVNGRKSIDVIMVPAENDLGEVVVVAFGKQKKEDVVGAITTVNPGDLKVPSSNLTTALAGRVAGMIAYQRSGEPGADDAAFFIRGVTTFGYNKGPLILIDGVEAKNDDLIRLRTDDIASFSILKDATSTALYGSRAANGVILITTKQGKEGKAKYFARVETNASFPTQNVELADPVTYMKLANKATSGRNPMAPLPYSVDKINNTVPGADSYIYPSVDWRNTLFKSHTLNQRADVSVNGGGAVSRYYISGSFTQDNGVLKVPTMNNFNNNINLKTYSVRSNVDVNLSKTTLLTLRVTGVFEDYVGPIAGGNTVYNEVMHASPVLFPPYYQPDSAYSLVHHVLFGNADNGQYNNPYANMVKGYKSYSKTTTKAHLELQQDLSLITEGLNFTGMAYTNRYSYYDVTRAYNPFYYKIDTYNGRTGEYTLHEINSTTGTEYLDYPGGTKLVSTGVYLQAQLNYKKMIRDRHSISSALVYQFENRSSGEFVDLITSLPFHNVGVSGRATYSYDQRYNMEFVFGYNGSEAFAQNHRWGFFPSIGASWNVSKEGFWDNIRPVIGQMKLRATYGLVGNDAISSPSDRFFYLSNVNLNATGKTGAFGTNLDYGFPGIDVIRYANPGATWEVARKTNVGLEMKIGRGFSVEADYFREERTHILMERTSVPANMGLRQSAIPLGNVGGATNEGIDGSIDYTRVFSPDFWLQGRFNFTYAHNEYNIYEEPKYVESPWLSHVGQPIAQQWGFIAERLFIDDKEVYNSPRQNFGEYGPGDIKYVDVNGDGEITDRDKVPIGFPTDPEIVYGFGISAGYKRFDLSFFFQGAGRSSFWIDAAATAPFQASTQLLKAYADDHWSPDTQNPYALWPRLSPTLTNNNAQNSTWFMRNGTFLRLKQVELGYSLSKRLMEKWRMNDVRIYLTASNLFLLSHFDLWDVEMAGNGLGYPLQRTLNLGFTTNF